MQASSRNVSTLPKTTDCKAFYQQEDFCTTKAKIDQGHWMDWLQTSRGLLAAYYTITSFNTKRCNCGMKIWIIPPLTTPAQELRADSWNQSSSKTLNKSLLRPQLFGQFSRKTYLRSWQWPQLINSLIHKICLKDCLRETQEGIQWEKKSLSKTCPW